MTLTVKRKKELLKRGATGQGHGGCLNVIQDSSRCLPTVLRMALPTLGGKKWTNRTHQPVLYTLLLSVSSLLPQNEGGRATAEQNRNSLLPWLRQRLPTSSVADSAYLMRPGALASCGCCAVSTRSNALIVSPDRA